VRLYAVLLLLLLTGCPANFIEPWEVAEPRLMGIKVEVEGDPSRPRPRLGESFALRAYLALPGAPLTTPLATRYSLALALCLGFETATGQLACLGEQTLTPRTSTVSDSELLLSGINIDLSSFGVPAGTTLDISSLPQLADLDRLALFGVLCIDGVAERVPDKSVRSDPPSQLFRCSGNEAAQFRDPTVFTMSVFLDRGLPADANKNPLFACDPALADSACNLGVTREGEPLVPGPFVLALPEPKAPGEQRRVLPWPASADSTQLPLEGCRDVPGLLQVVGHSGEHVIRARFDASDREPYVREIETNGVPGTREEREALLLTHALTIHGGELSRFDSLLLKEEVDSQAEVSVTYEPPGQSDDPAKQIPQNGRLVRFSFTLRDQRGGVDYATRELCLLPPEGPGEPAGS
jgi:hypothetical protein